MDYDQLVRKLELQRNPQILFSDIDGTLFSPNANLLTAPFFNIQTTSYLISRNIPFVIVTGRSFWRKIDQYHLKLLGVPRPDTVITANGTIIYHATRSGYISDFSWQGIMQSTKVTDNQGNIFSWNKSDISDRIRAYLQEKQYTFHLGRGNTYLIRIRFNMYPLKKIDAIRKEILKLFPKGIRIILTEKLLWKNSLEIFSGEMLITPATAGKDKAVQYLLKNCANQIRKPIHGFVFGDATVDIPMLTMRSDEKYFTLSQYGVHPTPLAREMLKDKMKENSNIHILEGDGPKEILWTLRPELRAKQGVAVAGVPHRVPAVEQSETKPSDEGGNRQDPSQFTPAQNNKARQIIQKFEWALDKLVDKNLSPNEISLLGLNKLAQGLSLLNDKSILNKTKGWYQYTLGNLTDILDGIRARNSDSSRHSERREETNGHLVDGFSDRAKEFMQLFHRAKKRIHEDEKEALQTFIAAISCALPSIAREQAEITGVAVPEKDEMGGSMIDRTKRLFLSLLFDSFGLPDQSLAKDKEILEKNTATFKHRLTFSKKFTNLKIEPKTMSNFQKKGLEKFLLYVDILQQEDAIIKKTIAKYKTLAKEYEKESKKLAKEYLKISVNELRKKWKIKDYKLEVKKYI